MLFISNPFWILAKDRGLLYCEPLDERRLGVGAVKDKVKIEFEIALVK
jgi:hypothetical protein